MPNIFVSYRRADSGDIAGRINADLISAFGADAVFKDSEDIPPGKDFRGVLRRAVAKSDVVLVLIGSQWLTIRDAAGNRRLDNPDDWVRFEVESGLQMDDVPVIPVLLNGATIPAADDLPVSLRELAFQTAINVRNDPDFNSDMQRLIASIRGISQAEPVVSDPTPAPIVQTESEPPKRDWVLILAFITLLVTVIGVIPAIIPLLRSDPPTPTSTVQFATPRTPVFEPARDLDIRSGPGSQFRRLNILPEGTGVDIMGISEDRLWYQILLADGTMGWILNSESGGRFRGNPAVVQVIIPTSTPTATDTLTLTPSYTPTQTETPTPTPEPSATPTASDTPPPTQTSAVFATTPAPTIALLPTDTPPAASSAGSFPCQATVTNPDGSATVINTFSEASSSAQRGQSTRVRDTVTIQRQSVDASQTTWYLIYSGTQRLGWVQARYLILSETCP